MYIQYNVQASRSVEKSSGRRVLAQPPTDLKTLKRKRQQTDRLNQQGMHKQNNKPSSSSAQQSAIRPRLRVNEPCFLSVTSGRR